jgi:transcriptional regulator with XRE-family HTH domain
MQPIPWPEIMAGLMRSGKTQPQIAEACGCKQSTVSDLLNGNVTNPRTSTGLLILKLARAHGIDVSAVLAGFLDEPEGEATV